MRAKGKGMRGMDSPLDFSRWIGCPACGAHTAPVFRRTFTLEKLPKKAELYISGLGFYALQCNGADVNDELLNPAFSRYDRAVYYNAVPLERCLHPGENVLEVTLGNGWYHQMQPDAWEFEHAVWKAAPRMICALYLDGERFLISDSQWMASPSGTVFNSLRCGETFDARQEPDWQPAQVVPGPGGVLRPQTIEPIRLRTVYQPRGIVPSAQQTIFDFGVNLAGNVEICVKGPRGAKVEIHYSEQVAVNGHIATADIRQHVYDPRFQKDEYILSGQGEECWHSKFGYNGFRYALVKVPKECQLLSVTARQFHTDLRDAGGISTPDAFITALQAAIRQSTLTNFHHMPTDCPHREKNGWTGDAWLSAGQAMYNFDMRRAYIKWLDDLVDCQRPSGQIPCIAPTSAWGYQWGSGITWDIALIIIPWQMYLFYGDASVLRRYAGPVSRYLDYLQSVLDRGIPAIGLGDWTAPPQADIIPEAALRTLMAIYAGRLCRQMAQITGDEALAEKGGRIAQACTDAFHREYDGLFGQTDSQLYYALLLELQLTDAPAGAMKELLRCVEKADGHLLGGIFSAYFVPAALAEFGEFDAAWKMVTAPGFPGWKDLIEKCAGTLGEDWFGGSSMNHHMYSSVGAWMYRFLAGIQPDAPGFARVTVAPHIPADLPIFSAWHDTPKGRISVAWENRVLRILIPEGTEAALNLQGTLTPLHAGENRIPF